MSSIGACAALLLASVFAWAGLAKLRAPAATTFSFAGLGLPHPRALARALPWVELALAVSLVWQPRAGSAAALVLLGVFSVVLARARARGVRAGCACFGGGRPGTPLSGALLRNALLAMAAVAGLGGQRGWVDVPAVVAVGTAAVVGVVALTLWDLRVRAGSLWTGAALADAGTGPERSA